MKPITDPTFKWIGSETHDAGSEPFRKRQRKRMADAEKARIEAQQKITPITLRKVKT